MQCTTRARIMRVHKTCSAIVLGLQSPGGESPLCFSAKDCQPGTTCLMNPTFVKALNPPLATGVGVCTPVIQNGACTPGNEGSFLRRISVCRLYMQYDPAYANLDHRRLSTANHHRGGRTGLEFERLERDCDHLHRRRRPVLGVNSSAWIAVSSATDRRHARPRAEAAFVTILIHVWQAVGQTTDARNRIRA